MKKTTTAKRGRPANAGVPRWYGPTLRIRRLNAGLSLEALGDAVGVTKATVLRWERSTPNTDPANRNASKPKAEHVRLLARALRCRPDAFSRKAKVS